MNGRFSLYQPSVLPVKFVKLEMAPRPATSLFKYMIIAYLVPRQCGECGE